MKSNGLTYLWQDRKRWMGMPLSFTRYALSEDRLFRSVGCFSIRDSEVLLYRIRDIDTSRTLWQRMFGMGTVTVMSSDRSTPTLALKNIRHPMEVKELLHRQVEEMKIRRRVRLGEIMAEGSGGPEDPDDDTDLDPRD